MDYIEKISKICKVQGIKTSQTAIPKFGSLKGKIHLSADFDAPLSDFQEYM